MTDSFGDFFLRLKLRWPIGNDYEDLERSSYLWKVIQWIFNWLDYNLKGFN